MDSRFSFSFYASIITLVSLIIGFFANQQIVASNNQTLLTDLKINLSEVEVRLGNEFASFREDIGFLYTTPPISGLTRAKKSGIDPLDGTTTALWKSRLEKIFMGFMQHNRAYFQLRIIDSEGDELIRVERVDNLITARDDNDMQDKSNRYYFAETSALAEGQLFVSTIDLNRENGELEFPYRPTLRLARAIFGEDNRFFGIIIVNIDVSYLLDELDSLVTSKYDILLTDKDGYFIKHPDEKLQYSRDLEPSLDFSGYYSVVPNADSPIKRYQTASQVYWGLDDELTVSGYSQGSELHPYIMLPDAMYSEELNSVRLQLFAALGGIWAAALLGLFLLSNNNKRLANLLKTAEEAQSAVNVADDAIITVNQRGYINTVNNAFENIFLVHRNECLGKRIADVYADFGCDEFQDHFGGSIKEIQAFEWRFKREGAPEKWLKTKIQPVKNSKSEAAFAIVTGNITAEKQATIEIEQNNQKLEATVNERTLELKSARDKALEVSDLKSNFISTISHEMRTPLNGIVGAVSLLKNQTLNSQQIELVRMAENSVDALRRLINDVLDLSKIEAGKLEFQHRNFNPEALVESIASTMSVVAHGKLLDFYIDTVELNVSMINSDPHRLTQVLTNLLNNAIKFTDRGYILIKAWNTIENDNGWIYLEVTDTGTGIAEAHVNKLFKAFSQADESIAAKYGGTGLGLSICKEILDLLGGSITVDSIEGKGSTFKVALPVSQWEEKSLAGKERLNNQTVGVLINKAPLLAIVSRLITSHGGTPLVISDFNIEHGWATLTMLMVEYNHDDFSQVMATYHTAVEKLQRSIKLIVISATPLTAEILPQGAVNLVAPVNRSAFLASVLDSRLNHPRLPQELSTEVERRSTDMPLADTTTAANPLNCKILVVDDNEINTQVARFILEPHNVNVAVVENGEKAIQHLSSSQDTYDIILMDCNMPVMNGYDATKAIRAGCAGELYKSTPIIAMTANAMKGESEKCMAAGMNDYITKPVEPSLLIRKISQHLPVKNDNIGKAASLGNDNTPPIKETNKMAVWNKDEALVRLGGREPLLVQLLHLFIKGAEQKFAAMKIALEELDREKLRFTAHALKGNAGDVGAEALHRNLAELEHQAPDAPVESLIALSHTTDSLLTETLELFNDYLQSHS